jgi:hypothetical protein
MVACISNPHAESQLTDPIWQTAIDFVIPSKAGGRKGSAARLNQVYTSGFSE